MRHSRPSLLLLINATRLHIPVLLPLLYPTTPSMGIVAQDIECVVTCSNINRILMQVCGCPIWDLLCVSAP
eukprot:17291-Prymnesium_polylepis.1